VKGNSNYQIAR